MPDRRTTRELFSEVDTIHLEVKERIARYLKGLGYTIYKVHDLSYDSLKRGNVQLIHLTCRLEINFVMTEVDLEVPLNHFDSLALPTLLAEPVAGGSQYASGHP